MKDLLEKIIKSIVDKKDDVKLFESTNAEGEIVLNFSVAPEDTGKIIGKEGKIIKAIRTIIRVLAIREGKRVNIDLINENPVTNQEATANEANS